MKPNKLPTYLKFTLFLLLLLLAVASTAFAFFAPTAYASPADPVSAAWEKARNAGSYQFTSDVTQITVPVARVTNIGRSSRSEQLHVEGQNDLRQKRLEMKLWSDGGSVLQSDGGVAVKVEDGKTFARRGTGEWQEADGVADTLAPQGDFLAYLQAMRNVEAHAPENRAGIQLTRYSFTLDGPTFAAYVRDQMQAAMHAKGELPLSANLEVPQYYRDMTGDGELWVGENGLPLRQILNLNFPEQNEQSVHAQIVVDFSRFGTPQLSPSELLRKGDLGGLLKALPNSVPNPAPLVLLLGALTFVVLVMRYRHSRTIYSGLVGAIILSMVVGPLLNTLQLDAFFATQEAKAASQETQQAEAAAVEELRADLGQPEFNPQVNPLEMGRLGDWESGQASPNLSIFQVPNLLTVDSGLDSDLDGLSDFAEERVGTDATLADSDGDGVNDALEVKGFTLAGKQWFADARAIDSNLDGIGDGQEWDLNGNGQPDDTDSDSTPDLFDQDNDDDGVPDRLDLAPFTRIYGFTSDSSPLKLTLKSLTANKPTFVDFQVRPTIQNHLWYAFNVLDWPRNDDAGQVQDIDGKTYADLAASQGRNAGVNESFGDTKLVPMLELRLPITDTNLPAQSDLTPYNISVNELNAKTRVVYVPLSIVTDEKSGQRVAFSGRMRYLPSGSWQSPHEVRLVWVVQVLNDIPCDPDDPQDVALGCAADHYIRNAAQVVQSYYDDFTLAGLNVTEEHGAKTALIYEDPTADPDRKDDLSLTALTIGLDQTFLSSRDADNNNVRDVDINELARRADRATNSSYTSDQRWALDGSLNILRVERYDYPTFDQATMFTAMTDTLRILNNQFNAAWSSDNTLMPTIAFAYEQQTRSLGLDAAWTSGNFVTFNSSSITVDMQSAIPLDTQVGLKWSHYCRANSSAAWSPCTSEDYWLELERRYGNLQLPGDSSDREVAAGSNALMQIYNLSLSQGINTVVQRSTQLISSTIPLLSDSQIAARIRGGVSTGRVGLKALINVMLMDFYLNDAAFKKKVGQTVIDVLEGTRGRKVITGLQRTSRATGTAIGAVASVIVAGMSVAAYFGEQALGSKPEARIALRSFTVAVQSYFSLFDPLLTIAKLASKGITLASVLRGSSTIVGAARAASVIGAVIGISITWGFFIYSVVNNRVSVGSPEFNNALATTIAATLYIILLTVLSLTVVGLILVGIVAVIDAILTAVCELGGSKNLKNVQGQKGNCFTLGAAATKYIAYLIYNYDLMIDTERGDLVGPGAPTTQLADPSKGFVTGNAITISLPITTHAVHKSPDTSNGVYILQHLNLFSASNLRSSTIRYSFTRPNPQTISGLDRGQMSNEWQNVGVDRYYGSAPMYGGYASVNPDPVRNIVLQPGINRSAEIYLNMGYAVPAYECWGVPLLSFITYSDCREREFEGNSSTKIDTLRYDIFPNTLDGMMAKGSKPSGGFGPAWDEIIPAMHDFDGDGLLAPNFGGLDPNDANWDNDGDGLSDSFELERRAAGVPYSLTQSDSDNDGLNDAQEAQYGSNPGVADSDNDGLKDGDEIAGWNVMINAATPFTISVSSDPRLADSDNDGVSDLAEKQLAQKSNSAERLDEQKAPYHPGVVNTPPVAIYTTIDKAIVLPGERLIYTTTAIARTELTTGVLDVALPSQLGASPAPYALGFSNVQTITQQLNLTAPVGSNTQTLLLTSTVRTRLASTGTSPLAWDNLPLDNPIGTVAQPRRFTALTPLLDRQDSYLVSTMTSSSLTRGGNGQILLNAIPGGVATSFFNGTNAMGERPADVACNAAGRCLTVWDQLITSPVDPNVSGMQAFGALLDADGKVLMPATLIAPLNAAFSPVVASDGVNFLIASEWAGGTVGTTYLYLRTISASGVLGTGRLVQIETARPLTATASRVALDLIWIGSRYRLAWKLNVPNTEPNPAIYVFDIDQTGTALTSATSIIGVDAFRTALGTPVLAYDPLRDRTLMVYVGVSNISVYYALFQGTDLNNRTMGFVTQDGSIASGIVAASSAPPGLAYNPMVDGWMLKAFAGNSGQSDFVHLFKPDLSGRILPAQSISSNGAGPLACPAFSSLPVADLRFEEMPGATTFVDSSGRGNNATCSGSGCPVAGFPGAVDAAGIAIGGGAQGPSSDYALAFTNNQSIAFPSLVNQLSEVYSVAFWYRARTPGSTPAEMSLSGQNNSLNVRIVNNAITFSVANNINNETLTGPSGMNNGAWHFVVATRDIRSNTQNLYVDGVAAPSTRTFTSLYPSVPTLTLSAKAAELDHLRIYKTPLSASAVKALYDRSMQSYCIGVGTTQGNWGKLNVSAPDTRGGKITASRTLTFTIDADKPKSSVTSVSNLQYLLGNTVHTIGGTASDPTSSVAKVEVSINGGAWQPVSGLNSWAFNLPIAEGPYTIQTRATDLLGNVETPSAPITVYGDTEPPHVDFSTVLYKFPVTPNRFNNQWVINLVGNVTDQGVYAGGVPTDAVQVLLQGQDNAQGNGWQAAPRAGGWSSDYFFAPGVLDPTGTYTVSLRAIDSAGNRIEVENAGTVRVDAFGPVAQVSTQDLARTVISNTLTLSGLVTDTGPAGVDQVQVAFVSVEQIAAISNTINSTQADALLNRTWLPASVAQNGAAATTWSIAVPAGLESEYQIDLRAYDKVGNLLRSDKAWRGIIDTLAPRVTVSGTLSSPWLNPSLNKNFYNVSVSCTVLDRYVDEASFTCPTNGVPAVRQFNTNPNLQALFPDRTILSGLNAGNTYSTDAPNSQFITRACDGYGHCSTATINPTSSAPACYWIENRATAYVLDISGGNTSLGAAVIAYPKNNPISTNQLWYVNGDGSIQSKLNGYLLDLLGFNTAAGAPLGVWSRNIPASNNQIWNRIDQGNGYFAIQSRLNNFMVEPENANAAARAVMQPQSNPVPNSQQWRLVPAPAANCGGAVLAAAGDLSVAQASVDTVSNLPKAVVVTPGEGNRVDAQGAVQVTIAAEAAQGLKEVTLSLDGEVVATFPFARTDRLQASLNSVDLNVADGPHTLSAQASDWAGNQQTTLATTHFVVTSQRPSLTIDSQNLNNGWPVNSGVVVLNGSVSNIDNLAAVQVRVGDQPFTNAQFGAVANGVSASSNGGVGQWSVAYPVVDPEGKTLEVTVRAIDKTGQVITVKQGVTGDYATSNPPETALVQTPLANSDETSASFAFTGTVAGEPSFAFECQLDDGAFTACSSPTSYQSLSIGSHNFQVRAINAQGYVDLTPAQFSWTVQGRGEVVNISEAPSNPSSSRTASFEFELAGSEDDGDNFECSLDGAAFVACAEPQSYTGLADGLHTFQVRIQGNPASQVSWRITNAAPVVTSTVVTTVQNANLALNLQSSDEDSVSYIIVKQPTQGRLLGNAPNLVYDPDTDFFGVDSFSFKADDGDATSNLATVTVNVTPQAGQNGLQRDGFVVFGTEGVILRENVKVMSGDIAASISSQGPWLGDGAEVSIGNGVVFADAKSKVLGDTVFVGQGTALANANYNDLRGPGTVKGNKVTPQALPLLNRFVAMPGIGVGKQNVEVAANAKVTLQPGSYLSLNVAKGGEVSFSGGVYSFKEWNVAENTKLTFAAASEVRISGRAIVGEHGYVGPAPSSAVSAKQIVIYVAGVNANTAVLGGLGAKSATFGPYATLAANVVVPNGTLLIRERSKAVGSFVARWVSVGKFSELTLANRFSPSTVEGRVDGYVNLTLDDATGINATAALSPNVNDELLSEEGTNEDSLDAVKKVFLPVISSGAGSSGNSESESRESVDSKPVNSVPEGTAPSEEEQTSKLFLPAVSR